jgi:hypothetical protein
MVYRGARKGRGLVVSPKDYSTKYRYWGGKKNVTVRKVKGANVVKRLQLLRVVKGLIVEKWRFNLVYTVIAAVNAFTMELRVLFAP